MNFLAIDRDGFARDPFGYSANAYIKWNMLKAMHKGGEFDPFMPVQGDELKNPVLWLSQAEALTQAALAIFKTTPTFNAMPIQIRSMCDSQFCAAGLMLVGYSLEIALKGMLLLEIGVDGYKDAESKRKHHRLHDLSHFIPDLSTKDKAILRGLTFFVCWAGRYPDPGSGKEREADEIFKISEKNQISAKDIFDLAARVMGHAKTVTENYS